MENINYYTNVDNIPLERDIDWKFGLITRSVYRKNDNSFEINDLSSGWKTAYVNKKTMVALLKGEKSLLELNWN